MSSWKDALGWAPGNSFEDVRRKYKKLAYQKHPNRNPGNPAATQEFAVISNAMNKAEKHYARSRSTTDTPRRRAPPRTPAGPRRRARSYNYDIAKEFIKLAKEMRRAREEVRRAAREEPMNASLKARQAWGVNESDGSVPVTLALGFKLGGGLVHERAVDVKGFLLKDYPEWRTGATAHVPGKTVLAAVERVFAEEVSRGTLERVPPYTVFAGRRNPLVEVRESGPPGAASKMYTVRGPHNPDGGSPFTIVVHSL